MSEPEGPKTREEEEEIEEQKKAQVVEESYRQRVNRGTPGVSLMELEGV